MKKYKYENGYSKEDFIYTWIFANFKRLDFYIKPPSGQLTCNCVSHEFVWFFF